MKQSTMDQSLADQPLPNISDSVSAQGDATDATAVQILADLEKVDSQSVDIATKPNSGVQVLA